MGISSTDALELLRHGTVTVKGRMPWASNVTLLALVEGGGACVRAIYKPGRGERPLWDFPPCLYKREEAAYLLSEALGWGLVPPTIVREGPLGEGSLQLFVEAEFEQHWFTMREDPRHRERLQKICVFDFVANNADRKSGHCLLGPDNLIYGIDNGLCFHTEIKLRTVIWDYAGEPLPRDVVEDLKSFVKGGLTAPLADLLAPDEQQALLVRAQALADYGRFPEDRSGHRYPWPLV
ncbi:MAG TPA: SCO1664 family protein [Candidatus Bathyarchaeia archaeon]|nr:SCO1664 family protein [Candidatus Bathyarchaeia archaeon]